MYYERDLTQDKIAKTLGLSRAKVYRLLKEARAVNVVQIMIDWPLKRDHDLEAALCRTFGLKSAFVLDTTTLDPDRVLTRLGQMAARYLERVLAAAPTMALCIGRTTYEVINAIHPGFQANVRVIQAIGSLSTGLPHFDSSSLARQLAQKLGGEAHYLASPALVDSPEAAVVLRNQREIKAALLTARTAEVALLGIGNLDPHESSYARAELLLPGELAAMLADGAAGDIAWQIFTQDGDLYPCDLNERVIGITLAELRQIPNTIAVAAGDAKARAILGGLRTGLIDVLCTDDSAARAVLTLNQ